MNKEDWAFLDKCGYRIMSDFNPPRIIKSKVRSYTVFPLILWFLMLALTIFAAQFSTELRNSNILFILGSTLFFLLFIHGLIDQIVGEIIIMDTALSIKKFRYCIKTVNIQFDEIEDIEIFSRSGSSRSPSSRISIQLRMKDGTHIKLFYFGAINKREKEKLSSLIVGLKKVLKMIK